MDSLTRTIQIHRPPLQTERRSRAVPVAVADASCEFPSASDKLLKGLSSLPPPDPLIRCIYVSKRPLVDGLSSAAYVSPAASLLETVQSITRQLTGSTSPYLDILRAWHTPGTTIHIVLNEIESFDTETLNLLLNLLQATNLPVIAILVAKTTLFNLPFCANVARIDDTNTSIDDLVSRLFITRGDAFRPRLAGCVYSLFYENFFSHTLDLDLFLRDVKFAHMDFEYEKSRLREVFYNMDSLHCTAELDRLRALPSFRKYIDARIADGTHDDDSDDGAFPDAPPVGAFPDAPPVLDLLNDDKCFSQWATFEVDQLVEYHLGFEAAFSCLLELRNSIQVAAGRVSKARLYGIILDGDLDADPGIKLALESFSQWSWTQIKTYLERCVELMLEYRDGYAEAGEDLADGTEEFLAQVYVYLDEFRAIEAELGLQDEAMSEYEEEDEDERDLVLEDTLNALKAKRSTKNSTTAEFVMPLGHRQTQAEKKILQVCDSVKAFFRSALRPPEDFVLYELVYYTNRQRYIKAFRFDQRATLKNAFLRHQDVLPCACPDSEMFDVGYAYRIFCEAGTQVNVFDWFVAFGTIVNANGGLSEAEVFSRFARAVSEMEFLGMLRWGAGKRGSDFCHKLAHW
ncbi:MAG: hypothetical protein SGCHY_000725 [Lobulomycetales sp.]